MPTTRCQQETSAHRRQRRSRTKARTLLRATKAGWISPTPLALRAATRALQGHHSNSTLVMAAPQSPWCFPCHKWVKKGSAFCLKCGTPVDTMPDNYQGQPTQTPWRATTSWVDPGSWQQPKAWRHRSPSPRAREKGKPKGGPHPPKAPKGGKGKPSLGEEAPPATAMVGLPTPPSMPSLTLPTSAATSSDSAPTDAQQRLDALMGTLRQARDTLPPDIAKLLGDQEIQDTHLHSKALHKAVTHQDKAKKELAKVRVARRNFFSSWVSYTDKISALLQKQFAEQQQTIEHFANAEAKWTEQLKEATANLARLSGSEIIPSDSEDMDAECKSKDEEDPWRTDEAIKDLQQRREAITMALRQNQNAADSGKRERSRTPGRNPRELEDAKTKQDAGEDAAAVKTKAATPPPA